MAGSRKTEIKKDLMEKVGGSFCTKTQLKEFCNYKDVHSVGPILSGLPKMGTGQGARYYVGDVADRLMEAMH